MRRLSITFLACVSTASASAELVCTQALLDGWSAAGSRVELIELELAQQKYMGAQSHLERMCAYRRDLRAIHELAQVYFPSCEPLRAARALPYLEDLVNRRMIAHAQGCE
jgi:hypothetical protein